jgi:Skp family chaperone for outer membrane proteins
MPIKRCITLCAIFLLLTATSVSAQESSETSQEMNVVTTVPSKPPRSITNKEISKHLDSMKNQMKDLRSDIQEKREAAKETAAAKKEALRAKIAAIKDTHKKAVVQRLDTRFETTNQTSTDRWTEALEKMTHLVDRVGSEAADLKSNGVDTATVDLSITKARAAILAAEVSVASQAGKTYVMPITTDATLRNTVGTTVSQFRNDLRNTHQTLVIAKKAVMDTVRALVVLKKKPAASTTTPPPVSTTSAVIEE